MNPTWLRVLVASAVVVILLSLAILEIVSERIRVEHPPSAVSNPRDEPWDRWQDFLITQEAGGREVGAGVEYSRSGP